MLDSRERELWIKSRRDMRKLSRNARKRRQAFKFMLLVGIFSAGVSGLAQLPWAVADLDQSCLIRGNQFTSEQAIKDAIAGLEGKALYSLNTPDLERKITALESVKHAFVRRYAFPRPRLEIEVLEEFPWARLAKEPEGETEFIIAESGRLIPAPQFPKVPRPELIVFSESSPVLKSSDVKQWATWMKYIEAQTGRTVDYIDIRRPFDVRVKADDLYLKLGIPDTTLTRRLARLTSILPVVESHKERLEHIDLALESNVPLKLSKLDKNGRSTNSTNATKGLASQTETANGARAL